MKLTCFKLFVGALEFEGFTARKHSPFLITRYCTPNPYSSSSLHSVVATPKEPLQNPYSALTIWEQKPVTPRAATHPLLG